MYPKHFFSKIFKKKEKTSVQVKGLKEVGETDCCPYCKEQLEEIPTRKTKCPYCGKYIYSRKRPLDRKKVLVTERQKEEIELEWTRFYEANEEVKLMQNDEYSIAKKELIKRFGKEPSLNDVKWRVYNQRVLKYASQKQWGLYRNNKLDMAKLLEKEKKLRQALSTLFEICYLDLNGCNNIGTFDGKPFSKNEMQKYGIKEFDSSLAFLAPGIVSIVVNLINQLNLPITEAKKLFVDINERTKPLKKMPIATDSAWERLSDEISPHKK